MSLRGEDSAPLSQVTKEMNWWPGNLMRLLKIVAEARRGSIRTVGPLILNQP